MDERIGGRKGAGTQGYLTYSHGSNMAYEIRISVPVLKPLGIKNIRRPNFFSRQAVKTSSCDSFNSSCYHSAPLHYSY